MGDIADSHVRNFTSGRWGMRVPVQREYPKTTKAAIAARRFSIVEVTGFRTNRSLGMRLVVTENDAEFYWVWTSKEITGIAIDQCKVIECNLDLNDALAKTNRKLYNASNDI
jgi:hypothetical protein